MVDSLRGTDLRTHRKTIRAQRATTWRHAVTSPLAPCAWPRPPAALISNLSLRIAVAAGQSLSHGRILEAPWPAARQASLPFTNSRSSLRLLSTESVMPSNHLILCRPLLLPPSIFPSSRVFSSESAFHYQWPK